MSTALENHYRVVRYEDQWPVGRMRVVVEEHLGLKAAQKALVDQNEHIPGQDLVIEDESTDEEIEIAMRDSPPSDEFPLE